MTFSRRSQDTSEQTKQSGRGARAVEEGFVTSRPDSFDADEEPSITVLSRHDETVKTVYIPQSVAMDTSVPREGERVYYARLLDDKGLLVGAHADDHQSVGSDRTVAHGHSASRLRFHDDSNVTLHSTLTLTDTEIASVQTTGTSFALADIDSVVLRDTPEQRSVTVTAIEVAADDSLELDDTTRLTSNWLNSAGAIPRRKLVTFVTNGNDINASDVERVIGSTFDVQFSDIQTVELTNDVIDRSLVELDAETGELKSRYVDTGVSRHSDTTVDRDVLTHRSYYNDGGIERTITVELENGNYHLETIQDDKDDVTLDITNGDVVLNTEEGDSPACTVKVENGRIYVESQDGASVEVNNAITATAADGTTVVVDNGDVTIDGNEAVVATDSYTIQKDGSDGSGVINFKTT